VRGDLLRILCKLLARPSRPEHVIIETTGLADPAPVVRACAHPLICTHFFHHSRSCALICARSHTPRTPRVPTPASSQAQTFFVDDEVKASYRLDAIVTLIDAAHVAPHLEEVKPDGVENEAVEQVAFADVILLNKTDTVSSEALDALQKRIAAINATAAVLRTRHAACPLDAVLGVGAFDLARTLEKDSEFLNTEGEHQHDSTVTSVGIRAAGPLRLEAVNAWLGGLLRARGTDIFRSKGVLCVEGSEERFVFQGVHMQLAMGSSADGGARPWGADEERVNRLVFIGRNLDREALQASFEACRAAPAPAPAP
jgi:G3E family GTPase